MSQLGNVGITDISYSIDLISHKSIFTRTSGGAFTIHFNVNADGEIDLNNPLPLTLGWVIGI